MQVLARGKIRTSLVVCHEDDAKKPQHHEKQHHEQHRTTTITIFCRISSRCLSVLQVEAEGKLYSVAQDVQYITPDPEVTVEKWWKVWLVDLVHLRKVHVTYR